MGKKKGNAGSGTWVDRELMYSRAFLSLKGFAPQLLILFLQKRKMTKNHDCLNKNDINMTYAEIENIHNRGRHNIGLPKDGINKQRFLRAIEDLMAKGFINIVHQGGAMKQDKSVFALTDDWLFWSPGRVIHERKKDLRHRGFRKANLPTFNEDAV